MTSWNSTELQTQHSNVYDEKKYEEYGQMGLRKNMVILKLSNEQNVESKRSICWS
jgi:hypothetical protein